MQLLAATSPSVVSPLLHSLQQYYLDRWICDTDGTTLAGAPARGAESASGHSPLGAPGVRCYPNTFNTVCDAGAALTLPLVHFEQFVDPVALLNSQVNAGNSTVAALGWCPCHIVTEFPYIWLELPFGAVSTKCMCRQIYLRAPMRLPLSTAVF